MDDLFLILFFLILGLFTGTAAGMLGIGGGIILIPSLFFSLPLVGIDNSLLNYTVIGTSLFCGTFASFSSALMHFKRRNIDMTKFLLFSSGSILTASILPFYVVQINSAILKIILGSVLTITIIKMLLEMNQQTERSMEISNKILPVFGLLTGALAALTGIGGGVLFVPILTYFYAVNLKRSIGTSSAIIFLTMFSSAVSYGIMNAEVQGGYQIGYINLFAGIPISIGALTGAVIGVRIVLKTPVLIVKRIFSLFLIIIILRMMIS